MPDTEIGISSTGIDGPTECLRSPGHTPMRIEEMIEKIAEIFCDHLSLEDVKIALENAKGVSESLPEKTALVAFPFPEIFGEYAHSLIRNVLPRLKLRGKRKVYRSKELKLGRTKSTGDLIRQMREAQDSNILVMPVRTDFDHTTSNNIPDSRRWRRINLGAWEVGLLLIVDPSLLMRCVDPSIMCPGDIARDQRSVSVECAGPQTRQVFHPCYSIDERGDLLLTCRHRLGKYFGEAVAFFPRGRSEKQ